MDSDGPDLQQCNRRSVVYSSGSSSDLRDRAECAAACCIFSQERIYPAEGTRRSYVREKEKKAWNNA